jgi:outer membrane protein assembly factor BamB
MNWTTYGGGDDAIAAVPIKAGATISSAANQSFTVGQASTTASVITVTEASTVTITAANDIRIRIPATFNMTFDPTVTTVTLGGTASGKVSTTLLAYEDSNHTVVLNVTSNFTAGQTLTITGLKFTNFTAVSAANNLQLVTAGTGGATAATDNRTITIAAGATVSSAANQSFAVGQPATTASVLTVTEASTVTITAANDIRIRIPATFNMTWDPTVTTVTLGGTASGKVSTTLLAYEDSNHTVVLNVTSNFTAGQTLTITGLKFTNFTAVSAADNLQLVTAGTGGATAGTDNRTITITPQVLNNFLVEAAGGGNIGSQTAGTPFSIQITARDAYNNTMTSFTGTADITSTGMLSAGGGTTAAFTAGVLASTSVTISNTGSFTITATRTGGTEAGTSNAFTVCGSVADATYVAANAQGGQAIVYWASSNPALILQKSGSAVTDAPVNGTSYSVPTTVGASTVVYNGSVAETSFTQTGLTNGTTYYYKVFPKSGTCYAPGVQVIARPAASSPAWSYNLAGGSMLVAGIAGSGTIYTGSNASQIIGLSTANGTQLWAPMATTQPIQGWLTWMPAYGGWPYRKAITIDHTQVTAALTYFPVLISLTTDADLQTYAQVSGNDIFFTAADGTTKLNHEIETYTSSTGQLVAWVQVPSLSNTTDTVIYMYYGNGSAANQQNAGGVWDTNFKGVWHLPNGTTLTASDSTSNANNGTKQNAPTAVAGQIDGGASLNGTNQYISTTTSFANPQDFTVSAWFETSTASGRKIVGFETSRTGTTSTNYDRQIYMGTDGHIYFGWYSGVTNTIASTNALNDGLWHHAVGTHTSGNVGALYIDGVLQGTGSNAAQSFTGYWRIGSYKLSGWTPASDGYFTGQIDEVRVSNIARSGDWVTTEYNNQSSPGTFYTVGTAQAETATVVLGADQSGTVYSVDVATGVTTWQVQPNAGVDYFQAPVAVQAYAWATTTFQTTYNDDVLFVPTRNASTTTNKLYAIKRNTGATAWSFNGTVSTGNSMDIIVGMPWVDYARNYVYVVSYSNSGAQPSLWVINSLTGAKVASFSLGDIQASPTLSVDGKTVYVGTTSGRLYAVDMSTLALKWSGTGYVNLGTNVAVQGFIWENGDIPGRLYFATSGTTGCTSGCVWALQDPGSGAAPPTSLWKTAVASPSTPLPLGNPAAYLYVGSSDGKVHKLDLNNNGADVSQTQIGDGSKQVGDVSSETGNELFVGTTEGTLYKLSPLP